MMLLTQVKMRQAWQGGRNGEAWPQYDCLVGDTLDADHPGYSTKLRYASFPAEPAAFGEKEAVKAIGARQTFLMVMEGCLRCHCSDGYSYTLAYPQGLDLPPLVPMRLVWEAAAPGRCLALGRLYPFGWTSGAGMGYEFHVFDLPRGMTVPIYLSLPEQRDQWSYQFVELFAGAMTGKIGTQHVDLGPGQYAYIAAQEESPKWTVVGERARGVALYY